MSGAQLLAGRIAIVTGGGRGLGRVMALAMVQAGARVVITAARSKAELQETAATANACRTGSCVPVLSDVGSLDTSKAVVDCAVDAFGGVDIVVNNAARGAYELFGKPDETGAPRVPFMLDAETSALQTMTDVNLMGPIMMAKAALPSMRKRGSGRIINISTSRPTMIRTNMGLYGPIKAALETMTLVWARELAGQGVTVNVLLPGGATDTAILPGRVGERADRSFRQGKGPKGLEGTGGFLPPEIMAAPIVWLASLQSDGVTGRRFIARDWDPDLPPARAAEGAMQAAHSFPTIM